MTLTDTEDNACCKSMQPTVEHTEDPVGLALRESLWQALEQDRLKCGVVECAHLLEIDPFNVTMCVMPVAGPDDVTALIQRTLIEAFCHEYHIRLIKVDSASKLTQILQGRTPSPDLPSPPLSAPLAPRALHPSDVTCVLVQGAGCEGEEGGYQQDKTFVYNDNHNSTVALPD